MDKKSSYSVRMKIDTNTISNLFLGAYRPSVIPWMTNKKQQPENGEVGGTNRHKEEKIAEENTDAG